MSFRFGLFLFSTDIGLIPKAVAEGVEGIVVDWENVGKTARQAHADTQINHDTLDDLVRVRACTAARLICRINSYGSGTGREVEQAIAAGADELLLPMVRTCGEVNGVLEMVAGRCGVGILVETQDAAQIARDLACLPLSRVYVGLNDLAIDRGTANIFAAVADGTVEQVREHFTHLPFGFGGLTLPGCGHPVPCRLLIAEMVRLRCDFSFLRRSFLRDIREQNAGLGISRILDAIRAARQCGPDDASRNRKDLHDTIRAWQP